MKTIALLLSVVGFFQIFSVRAQAADAEPSTPSVSASTQTPATGAVAVSTPAAARYEPPQPPAHTRGMMDTTADTVRDLADTIAFLEAGQTYFRAFARDTHTIDENQRLLEFLKDYDAELVAARKKEAALRSWLEKASALK